MGRGTDSQTDVRPNRKFKHMSDNGVDKQTDELTKKIVKLGLSPSGIFFCKFYFFFFFF